ncbi:protein kinase A regulatory subunit [Cristinia sonorae]|uniref:cAMP-dependent protein kinase regulatory subunit n=1 Tax=Cristinia sonorae TaxID=1940300 RepID=A0A8K0UVY3_9AGAR|nr:protein kinase A regulatory subunit [Cristinia sonorae]
MATFDSLIADLSRDVHRVQPQDALQFCANWFQARLEEQRSRTRRALATSGTSSSLDLPQDHFLDTSLSPTSSSTTSRQSSFAPINTSRIDTMSTSSPFGTLNVPGNALLSGEHRPSRGAVAHNTFNPTFAFDQDGSPSSPTDTSEAPNPFASFSGGSVSADDSDYLHAPSSTIFARRTSVSAESIAVDEEGGELPVFPKTSDQLRRIRSAIANNFIFRDLDEEQETGALNAMQELKVGKDEVVIRQGDVGEYFYVVEEGMLYCYIRSEPPPPFAPAAMSSGSTQEKFLPPGYHAEFGRKVAECKEGSSFGELALMYGHPRAATVVSMEPCTLWSLDRITFRTIILKAAHRRRTMYEQFLSSVPLLSSLGPEDRSKIADALVSRVYGDGEAVVKEGEMGDTFFFVEEGEAVVTKTIPGQTAEKVVMTLRKGDYFGELSLLRLEPRAATVSAIKRTDLGVPKLKVAALDAHAFTRLLGPLREAMDSHAGQAYGAGR